MSQGTAKTPLSRFFYASNNTLICQVGSLNTRLTYGDKHLVAQAQKTTTALLQTLAPNTVIAMRGTECSHVQIYTPYGFSRVDTMLTSAAYAGAWRDSASGNYSLGAGRRFMSPVLQRFLSSDDFSPFGGGGINAYAYCEGDPINNFDPSGRVKKQIPMVSASVRKATVDTIFDKLQLPKNGVLQSYLVNPEPASLDRSSSVKGLSSLKIGYVSKYGVVELEVSYDDRLNIDGYRTKYLFNSVEVPRLVREGVWVPVYGMSERRERTFRSAGYTLEGVKSNPLDINDSPPALSSSVGNTLKNRFNRIQAAVVQVRDPGENDKKNN